MRDYRWSDSVVAQGIRTLEDLAALSEDEVLGIHGIGLARLAEIIDVLWENDLELVVSEDPEAELPVDPEPLDVDASRTPPSTAVQQAVHARVAPFAADPADAPFAAIAERLAREVDESGNPYVARELRMVLGALGPTPTPATGDAGEPPTVEDEVAKARRERQEHRGRR
ncbi:hypothetical protein [Angustibacter luteus]